MYGSPAMNKDLNLPFQLSPYRQGKDEPPQMSSGLLRYRSAPSVVHGEVCEELLPPRASGTEAETMFPRFAAPDPRDYLGEKQSASASHGGSGGGSFTATPSATAPHVFFQWHQPSPQEHDQHQLQQHQNQQMQNLSSGGGGTSLLRHGSSPAGLFANLNSENGFGGARAMGSGMSSFASRQGSLMSQISEIGAQGIGEGTVEDGGGRRFLSGYPVGSWDDSVVLSDSFSKRIRDPSEVQNGDMRSHHHAVAAGLTHHLSLPKSTVDMAAMERYLQFQDAVPCKVRAKRGCATHPRSIAERVRRTRISERIKKLQDLVPNMDKQTNTADMLDLAVDYIKDLQRQAKALSDSRANCACSSRHKP